VFKGQVFALTSVSNEKQKIIMKGGRILEDTTDMKTLNIRDGTTFMLIGTPEEKHEKIDTSKKVVFAEDLSSAEKAKLYQQKTGVFSWVDLKIIGANSCWITQYGKYVLYELMHSGPKESERTQ